MIEEIMEINSLPSFISKTYKVSKIRVKKGDNGISIEPVNDSDISVNYICPFIGTVTGGDLTVDKFIELKQIEKEKELKNEKYLYS